MPTGTAQTGLINSAPSTPPSQLATDWNNYWTNGQAGDTQAFGTGKLTRNNDNTATLVGADGAVSSLSSVNNDFEAIAKGSPDVARQWYSQYGYDANAGNTGSLANTANLTNAGNPVNPATSTGAAGTAGTAGTATNTGNSGPRTVGGAGRVANAASTGYQVADYGPQTNLAVTPDQTVSEQVRKLIAENSPLQQQAETRSDQKVNDRGLLHSSLAVGAGQAALYDAALPIAGADAATYANTARYNADVSNQRTADQFNSTNQANQFAANASNQTSQFNADSTNRQIGQDVAAENQLILSNLDRENRIQLSNIEADYRSLIQVSSSASDIYRQTLNAIANAVADTNTDAAAKSDIINGYTGYLQNSLNLIGSINGVDLTGLLDFGTVAEQG